MCSNYLYICISKPLRVTQLKCRVIVSIVVHYIYMTWYVLTGCYILVSCSRWVYTYMLNIMKPAKLEI